MDTLKNEKLKALFNKFDKNRTGYIERDELKQLLIALGESPSSIRIEKLVILIIINLI
jgi:Ca2+-binding EF-hand superfamily protein